MKFSGNHYLQNFLGNETSCSRFLMLSFIFSSFCVCMCTCFKRMNGLAELFDMQRMLQLLLLDSECLVLRSRQHSFFIR